jgi:hypothetical protein
MLKAFLNKRPSDKIGNPRNPDQTTIDPRQRDTLTEPRGSALAIKREAYTPKPAKRSYPRLRRNPASGVIEPFDVQGKSEQKSILKAFGPYSVVRKLLEDNYFEHFETTAITGDLSEQTWEHRDGRHVVLNLQEGPKVVRVRGKDSGQTTFEIPSYDDLKEFVLYARRPDSFKWKYLKKIFGEV